MLSSRSRHKTKAPLKHHMPHKRLKKPHHTPTLRALTMSTHPNVFTPLPHVSPTVSSPPILVSLHPLLTATRKFARRAESPPPPPFDDINNEESDSDDPFENFDPDLFLAAERARMKKMHPSLSTDEVVESFGPIPESFIRGKGHPVEKNPQKVALKNWLKENEGKSQTELFEAITGGKAPQLSSVLDPDSPDAHWSTKRKLKYNTWLFRKLSSPFRRALYSALIIQGFWPPLDEFPTDREISSEIIEIFKSHSILIPRDGTNEEYPMPAYHDTENNPHHQFILEVMFFLEQFEIVPRHMMKDLRPGFIHPKIRFLPNSGATMPFNLSVYDEHNINPFLDEEDKDLPPYSLYDALQLCFRMVGFYDVDFYTAEPAHDESVNRLRAPKSENPTTSFPYRSMKPYPYHDDVSIYTTRLADEFSAQYLNPSSKFQALKDIHDHFYRCDVIHTLHPQVSEVYDHVLHSYELCSTTVMIENDKLGQTLFNERRFVSLVNKSDIELFCQVIRDCYLQTLLYEQYLTKPHVLKIPYYHINVDWEEQLQQVKDEIEMHHKTESETADNEPDVVTHLLPSDTQENAEQNHNHNGDNLFHQPLTGNI